MPLPVVLVGSRAQLVRALERRGAPVRVVEPSAVDAADAAPAARVYAVTERAVLAAARLQERIGAPGIDPAQALAFRDKLAMKRAFAGLAIPHARHAAWPGGDVEGLVRTCGYPLVIKPRRATSGVGRRVAGSPRELRRLLAAQLAHHAEGLLVEELLRAREVSTETFVSKGRIVFQSTSDYVAYGTASRVPAMLDAATHARVLALAARASLGLGLTAGVTHAEFFLTERGPLLSEIACRPPGGHLFELIGHAWDVDPWDLLAACLLGQPVAVPGEPARSAGNVILHPHAGRIKRVRGFAAARRLPGVVSVRHHLARGDDIPHRTSLGQIRGVITAVHEDPAVVQRALRDAMASVRVELDSQSVL